MKTDNEFDYIEAQTKRLNAYAFPGRQFALIGNNEIEVPTQGLTKREYFAAMAMQSLINYYGVNDDKFKNDKIQPLAEKSILIADKLLKQLESKS